MKRIVFLYVGLAIAALGYAAFWFYRADRVEDAIDAGTAALAARGWDVSHGGRRVSGFPYRLAARFDRPAVASADGSRRWESESATVYAEPWDLRHYVVVPGERHVLRMSLGGVEAVHDIVTQAARGSVVFDRASRPLRGVAEISGLTASRRGGERTEAAKMVLGVRRDGESAAAPIELSVRIDGLRLAETPHEALGSLVALLAADATLSGPPPGGRSAADGLSASSLARWRDGGGALDLRALSVDWGPVSLRGSGRLSLDGALRPEGEIESRIAGFPALIEALVGLGVIGAETALALSLGVGLLAETPADGGPPEVRVPISLGGGRLSIGPAPIVELPPLAVTPGAPR